MKVLAVARVLTGAVVGAALLWAVHVPAGILVGAVIGSACANLLWPRAEPITFPPLMRQVAFVLLGTIAGVRLEMDALVGLARIAIPVLLAVGMLLVVNLLLAVVLVRRSGLDPQTAVLAAAPGGLSEIAGVAVDVRAQVDVVVAVHTIRVLLVVLVVLPLAVAWLPAS